MYICRYPENHPRSTCCGIANVGVIEHQSASTSVPPAFFHPLTPHPLLSIGKPFPQELTDTRTLALVLERCHWHWHLNTFPERKRAHTPYLSRIRNRPNLYYFGRMKAILGRGSKKNVPFSSLLLLRGPATPPPLVVPWAIKILGPYFFVK